MTGLYVKKKLIISCRPTIELSARHFHVFLPAASGTMLLVLFRYFFNVSLRSLWLVLLPLSVSCIISCQTPEQDAYQGLVLQTTAGPWLKPLCSTTAQMHFQLDPACWEEFSIGNMQPPILISTTLRQVMNETSEIMVLSVLGPCNQWQSSWQGLL